MSIIDQFTGNSVPLNQKILSSHPFNTGYSARDANHTYIINFDGENFIYTKLTEYGSDGGVFANNKMLSRAVAIGDFELQDGFVSGSVTELWNVGYRSEDSEELSYRGYSHKYGPKKSYKLPPFERNKYGDWKNYYGGFHDYFDRGVLPAFDDEKYYSYFRDMESNNAVSINPSLTKYFPDKWWENPWGLEVRIKRGLDISNDSNEKRVFSPIAFKKKFVDKVTNFNPSTDTLEIDTDSFGINSTATFSSGKNKKAVKKKLAKQDFDFLYDDKKGGLYFNENGSDKGFGEGGIIAILKGAPDLTSDNLEFI